MGFYFRDHRMLSVGATKGLCAALSTLITFGIGVAPWKLRKYVDPDNHKHVLATSFLLCFGAGVLLATSLAHMAPEVRVSVSINRSPQK